MATNASTINYVVGEPIPTHRRAFPCRAPRTCSVFAKAYPCDEEGAIECSDCKHTHHCDMEDRRDEIRDAFLAGMNYTPNAGSHRQEEAGK